MTDDTKSAATNGSGQSGTGEPVDIVVAAVGDEAGIIAEGAIVAKGDHALLVARFANMDLAKAAYEALRDDEAAGGLHIDGVLVVNADEKGKIRVQKMTDHSTRTGFAWGAVAGVVLGIIFPPSILASAAAVGVAGAAVGKIGNVVKKANVAEELADVITPGSSGILALVDVAGIEQAKSDLGDAKEVKAVPVDDETAKAIKEVAAAADAPNSADAADTAETPASTTSA
jgi:uncharacterized membrane protein